MVKQIIGPLEFRGMKLSEAGDTYVCKVLQRKYARIWLYRLFCYVELEWMLGQAEAILTKIKEDPRPKINDVLFSSLKNRNDLDDDNDW